MVNHMTSEQLKYLIRTTPMLSHSAIRLLQLTASAGHDLREVADLVKSDANLTARVLRVVNSAAFGLLASITSIERAISYLGERLVVGIALAESAGKLFEKQLDGYEAPAGALWKHDLRAAIAAREVAVRGRMAINPDLAFTAGLLHDIGKALISEYLQGSAPEAIALVAADDSMDYLAAERQLAGYDHTQAGFELAKAWRLPKPLETAIRYHHEPAAAPEEFRPLVYAIHLSDSIAMLGGCGTGADCMLYRLDPAYAQYVNLAPEDLESIMLAVDMEFTKLSESLAS